MTQPIDIDITGPGLILYSPFAVAHIREGQDYLTEHFWELEDVARHVAECRLTAFGTGSPGRYQLRFREDAPDEAAVQAARFKLRLGLEVRDGTVCVRDLYDLMDWTNECPEEQMVSLRDGLYRITVYSSPPASGVIGDGQTIHLDFERTPTRPLLRSDGLPTLCDY